MKYEIQVMVAVITEENMADIREILFGNPYDVIYYSEGGDLLDSKKEAVKEFKKQSATARRQDDGTIGIRIPELLRGEEKLDEDILQESGEEVYYLDRFKVLDCARFDEESLQLFRELGYEV